MSMIRSRWAAVGAAVAVTLGAGGMGITQAAINSGDRAVFVPITPCRIIDTRPATHVGPRTAPLGPGESYTIAARGTQGDCNLPVDAVGLSMNITAVNATAQTNLRVFPTGEALPETSNLNPSPANSRTVNSATTKLSSTGQFNIANFRGNIDVIIDINGYYADHNHDDRYYTKAQTDTQISRRSWMESMPISSAHYTSGSSLSWTISSGGSEGPTGLTLHDVGYARFWQGFTLPPGYQAGTDVKVRISWVADIDNLPGCTFRLESNETVAYRPGQARFAPVVQFVGGPGVDPYAFPYVILTATNEGSLGSWSDNLTRSAEMILDGAGLAPGDEVSMAIARRADASPASQDTCTQGLTIVGMTAENG